MKLKRYFAGLALAFAMAVSTPKPAAAQMIPPPPCMQQIASGQILSQDCQMLAIQMDSNMYLMMQYLWQFYPFYSQFIFF